MPRNTRSTTVAGGLFVEVVLATDTEYHPAVLRDEVISPRARRLANTIEPVVGQVYFSPECHAEYEALGFGGSPAAADGVALPDGPAYFTSRGSLLGQAPGELVASAFAVFNPEIVVPLVQMGWSKTDAQTIGAARTTYHRGSPTVGQRYSRLNGPASPHKTRRTPSATARPSSRSGSPSASERQAAR